MPNEPSMEEILSSIKRIIAEEDGAQAPRPPRRATLALQPADELLDDQVLELTEAFTSEAQAAPAAAPQDQETAMSAPAKPESKPAKTEARASRPRAAAPAPAAGEAASVLSDTTAQAARDSLVNLSKLLVRPDDGPSNTLEGLVREMLRPMLKEWLDANLPEMVEGMVKREIDRITGRV